MKRQLAIALFVFLLAPLAEASAAVSVQTIRVDAASPGRVFEGIGAVSAGGNTCLLKDYPEPYRSDVLDFLFKPKFGAGFQHLKVEVGGGENSTCGSEPSHAIVKEERDHPKPRGFEFWLMHEARQRNPKIILDCLPWSYPAWCGGAFTQNSADWYVSFLNCAKQTYGLQLDYVGAAWNERSTDPKWVVNILRPTLNKAGYGKVKLHGPDHNGQYWQIFDQFDANPAFRDALDAVSYHIYGMPAATEKAKKSGKPLWMSETTGGGGAGELRQMIKFYVRDRITKFETWCPVASCYEGHTGFAWTGFVLANQPWSGHYEIPEGVWYAAHVTQFTEPGWKLLDPGCILFNPKNDQSDAGCIMLKDPNSDQWSLIAGTAEPVTVEVHLGAGLASAPIHVWKTGGKDTFVQQADIVAVGGSFKLALDGGCAYSITTTAGQKKGEFPHPVPKKARFPMPYRQTFAAEAIGATPKYFMDQKGTFEVADDGRGGHCAMQILPTEGTTWANCLKPNTIFGDNLWESYELSADVKIARGDVEIGGRHDDEGQFGYRFTLTKAGKWTLSYHSDVLASGVRAGFDGSAWHTMKIRFFRTQIKAFLDGSEVVSIADAKKTKTLQGRCFLASTYDPNRFGNLSVQPLDAAIPPSGMKATCSSFAVGDEPQNVLDGDAATIWHTPWAPAVPVPLPQSITLDLGGTFDIDTVTYLPREGGGNGTITAYNLYGSLDGSHFQRLAAGKWEADAARKVATFPAAKAAYVKLEATAGVGGFASAAEIRVYKMP
jgi:galactosylceramidase